MSDESRVNADGSVIITVTERYPASVADAMNKWVKGMNNIPDPQYDPTRIIAWLKHVQLIRVRMRKHLRGKFVHRHKGKLVRQGISPRSLDKWHVSDYVSYIDHLDTVLTRIARQEDPRDVELYKIFAPFFPGYRGTIRPDIVMGYDGNLTIVDRRMWPPFEGKIIGFDGKVSVKKTIDE